MKTIVAALVGIIIFSAALNPRFFQAPVLKEAPVEAYGSFDRRIGSGFVYQFLIAGSARRFSCTFCPFYRLPKENELLLSSAGSRLHSITLPDGTVVNDQTGKIRRIRWALLCVAAVLGFTLARTAFKK